MNSKLKDKNIDDLFKAILCLETIDECYNFFEDLCTIQELKALSQRLQVAKMLSEHHVYSNIVNETGASTATISRVNRTLNYGSGGYEVVFRRLRDKEKMSSYSKFAEYYDKLTQNISYPERAEYFHKIIGKFSGKRGILLDLACGTGSLSEEMAKLGYDVIGVDNSEEMLNEALDKKYDSGLPIQYLKQDMTKLDMFGTIDVTICALDSLNHLPDLSAIKKTVEKVSLFAEPQGLFIFDVNTVYKHKNILGNNTFVYDMDEVYCVWQNFYAEKDNRVTIHLDFFEADGEIYRRFEEEFSEIAFPREVLDKILADAGFEILAHYELDTFDEPTDSCEKLVYVARKVR